jgi:hypothetical protein
MSAVEPARSFLSRAEVRALTSCPACGAHRGHPCRRAREHRQFGWVRISNHMERVREAERLAQ